MAAAGAMARRRGLCEPAGQIARQKGRPPMSLSLYEASIPVFARALRNLTAILDKGAGFAAEKGLEPATLTQARLVADMDPLPQQVWRASDSAKGAAARLTGTEVPRFPDTEKSFPELKQRIAKTVSYLDSVQPAQFAGAEQRTVTLKFGSESMDFTAKSYLLDFALPNFFFHVTMAYAILRHKGVPIGKMDFLGGR